MIKQQPLEQYAPPQNDELLLDSDLLHEDNPYLLPGCVVPPSIAFHLEGTITEFDACYLGKTWGIVALHGEFERLVLNYQAYLLSLAYNILGDWHAAEDVVQETWKKAFENLKMCCERDGKVDMSKIRGFETDLQDA